VRTNPDEDRWTFEVLDEIECRHLLRWEPVGRIAFVEDDDAPTVLPVNFVVVDDDIVFRTEPGLAERLRGRAVSFQVDRVDTYRRVGWSVLVRGHAELLATDDGVDRPADPWAPGDRSAGVRVVTRELTGRRLELSHAPLDGRAYL